MGRWQPFGADECAESGAVHLLRWSPGQFSSPVKGIGFLAGFYVTIVAVSVAIILGFGLASCFDPRVSRAMLGISTLALLLFGAFQVFKALA